MTNPDFQFIRDMDTFTFEIAEGFLRESCFVTFEATKSLHTQCTITVKEKPIKWEDRLPDLRVREGREIVLPCKLSRPDVPCEWYFNEDPIENNKRTKIAHNFFKHQLTIKNARYDDEGEYECITDNGRKTSSHVKIEPLKVFLLEDFPSEIVINEGEPFCLPVAYRPSDIDVDWKFNGGCLPEDMKESWEMLNLTTGDGKKVEIKSEYAVSDIHAGVYTVDICGKIQKQCEVKIKPPVAEFSMLLPEIQTVQDDCDRIELFCKVNRPNLDVLWHKNGKQINIPSCTFKQGCERRFLIPNPLSEDSGVYTCSTFDSKWPELDQATTECEVSITIFRLHLT